MRWTALAITMLLIFTATASADKVTDALSAAQSAYAEENYKDASTQIQTALVGVNERLIELLIAAMPDPPAGWSAEEPEGMDATAMGVGFFAGLMVDRTYTTPSGSTIEFTIAANSPMLSTLRMFVSNPMLAQMGGQEGMQAIEVCGYDAIGEFDGRAALNVLAGNATLISLESSNESDQADVMTLANATDCQTIVAIVE
jgi:hypothetical protein